MGSALDALAADAPETLRVLRDGAHSDPFVANLLHNVETGLATSCPDIAARYASLVDDRSARERMLGWLVDERERTEEALDRIFGGTLRERRPRMIAAIEARAPALARVHDAQIALLAAWRPLRSHEGADPREADDLLRRLLMTVNAIAAGLQSTG